MEHWAEGVFFLLGPSSIPMVTLRNTFAFQAGLGYGFRSVSEAIFSVHLLLMTWVQESVSLLYNLLS